MTFWSGTTSSPGATGDRPSSIGTTPSAGHVVLGTEPPDRRWDRRRTMRRRRVAGRASARSICGTSAPPVRFGGRRRRHRRGASSPARWSSRHRPRPSHRRRARRCRRPRLLSPTSAPSPTSARSPDAASSADVVGVDGERSAPAAGLGAGRAALRASCGGRRRRAAPRRSPITSSGPRATGSASGLAHEPHGEHDQAHRRARTSAAASTASRRRRGDQRSSTGMRQRRRSCAQRRILPGSPLMATGNTRSWSAADRASERPAVRADTARRTPARRATACRCGSRLAAASPGAGGGSPVQRGDLGGRQDRRPAGGGRARTTTAPRRRACCRARRRACWSSSTAFSGARRRRERCGQLRPAQRQHVRTESLDVGIEGHPAEATRVVEAQPAAVVEAAPPTGPTRSSSAPAP